MPAADDIARIIEQEKALVFPSFDEAEAFALGSRLRKTALDGDLPIIIDIRLWDRPLFYAALPRSTASNHDWARRKLNAVRLTHKPSYRLFLETGDQIPQPRLGLAIADYAFAGGAFPIRVAGAGVVGAVAISGLPQRQDHNTVVAALAAHLGQDAATLALAAE